MEDNATYEWIEDYLKGRLSPEERQAFEARCKSDAEFAKEVSFHLLAAAQAQSAAEEALRQKWKVSYPIKKKLLRESWIWAAAAVMLLLISLGIMQYLSHSSLQAEKDLFAQYFELLPPQTVRDTAFKDFQPWEAAMSAYQKGNFEAASTELLAWLPNAPHLLHAKIRLFLGICQMKTKQWDLAIETFAQVDPASIFEENARWYTALSYLGKEDIKQTKFVLKEIISKRKHVNKASAARLLEELEKR